MSFETLDELKRQEKEAQGEEKKQEKQGLLDKEIAIEIDLEKEKEREDKDPDTITLCPLTKSAGTLSPTSEKPPVLSLSLQIPGTGLLTTAPSSEPSSSAPSSEPASPNPLADSDILSPRSPLSETPPSSTSTHASASSLSLAGSASTSVAAAGGSSEQSCPAGTASPSGSGSTTAGGSALSVKFAPLPELAPRKRRSTTPLGMAARGQLMRRRKGTGHMSVQQQQQAALAEAAAANPAWTPADREEERMRQEEMAARYAHYQASAAALAAREEEAQLEEEEEEERERERRAELMKLERARGGEARVEREKGLGKAVKGLLRRVGRSRDAESAGVGGKAEAEVVLRRRKSDIGRRPRGASSPGATTEALVVPPPVPPLPLRPILATLTSNGSARLSMSIGDDVPEVLYKPEPAVGEGVEEEEEEEEGGVWEEEIGDSFPMNVGQTETIIEGRAVYASVAATAAPSSPTTTITTTGKVEMGSKSKADSKSAKASAPKSLPVKSTKVVSVKS